MKVKEHHRRVLEKVNTHLNEHPISSLVIGDHQAPHTLTARLVRSRGRTLVITSPKRLSEIARQYLACNVPMFTPVKPPEGGTTHTETSSDVQGDGTVTVWPVNQLRELPGRRWKMIIIDVEYRDMPAALRYAAAWRESVARGGRITVLHPPQGPQAALRWRSSRSGPLLSVEWDAQSWHERLNRAFQELPEGLFKPRQKEEVASTVRALPVPPREEPSWRTQEAARTVAPARREIPINTESDGHYPRTKKRWSRQ